jgi:energy-coupling factor transporter ATP-binding protein EcfA2
VSRRRARLLGDLTQLASELEELGNVTIESPEIDEIRRTALEAIRGYVLPRLETGKPPILVALVGSTGAGKSTLLNSLAGAVISPAGVLRPTTKMSRFWVSAGHSSFTTLESASVIVGSHPLLEKLILVDTPDLDSDLPEHRSEALLMADRADAVLFVTTAARYGDAIVWQTLTELARDRRVAVILNRTPSRAVGARNHLVARLRRAGLEEVEVFTISEQRIDPKRRLLPPQALQRLAAYLKSLSLNPARLDAVASQTALLVAALIEWLNDRNRRREGKASALGAELSAIREEARARTSSRRRWRRSRLPAPEILERLEQLEAERAALEDPIVLDHLRSGHQVLVDADFEGIWGE